MSIRSLQSISAGSELTISYTDITAPSYRRQVDLRSMYYFNCACEYCTAGLTCGLPDVPTTSKEGPSSAKILEIEAEGERLQASVGNATSTEKIRLLDQAMRLFVSNKDIFPIWRHPWPLIRDELRLLHWSLDNWSIATVHALKEYFFIEPVLYPVPWHPIRIQRLFLLLKLIYELQYQVFASDDNEVEGDLKGYYINWLSVNKGLEQEIQTAIPKAFGTDSSFAEEYKRLPKSEPPEHYGLRMDWPGERAKLRKVVEEIAD
ncbi:MAG: hypothetical protein Q9213_000248 [Squamulea squamosa]